MPPTDDNEAGYQGRYVPAEWVDPPGWIDGAPTSGHNQRCAFRGSASVVWVHPLRADQVQYRVFGKGHTLPTFWTLCDPCERVYIGGHDDAAVDIMRGSDSWMCESNDHIDQVVRQPLEVFRRADKGGRRLVD